MSHLAMFTKTMDMPGQSPSPEIGHVTDTQPMRQER